MKVYGFRNDEQGIMELKIPWKQNKTLLED